MSIDTIVVTSVPINVYTVGKYFKVIPRINIKRYWILMVYVGGLGIC